MPSLIDSLKALIAENSGCKDEALLKSLKDALQHATRIDAPFRVVKVEFLLPRGASVEALMGILMDLRDRHFNAPIAEWRAVEKDQFISGPSAEMLFESPDLTYPGKGD